MACAGPLDTAPATPLHYAPYRAPDSPQRTPRPMSPPRFVNIGPYSFAVTPGYSTGAEGFVVGEAELEVLDTARAERVRKKGFKVLEKLRVKSGRRTLSEGELRHLTSTVAEFDREVRLERTPDPRGLSEDDRVRQRPPRLATPSVEPELGGGEFDAEVIRLAELRVASEEAARGVALAPEVREAALAALREDPLLREAARARVEAALQEREKMQLDLF